MARRSPASRNSRQQFHSPTTIDRGRTHADNGPDDMTASRYGIAVSKCSGPDGNWSIREQIRVRSIRGLTL